MEAPAASVLVTGANGFVGSHLTAHLLRKGHRVRVLVRATSDLSALDGLEVDRVVGDVTRPESLPEALAGIRLVFHVAGLTKTRRVADYFRVNEEGTRSLARAAAGTGGIERFLYVSSLAAMGPSPAGRPRQEGDPPAPTGPYGESKLAGESAAREELDGRLPLTIVRPATVYGPWERDLLTMFKMARMRIGVRVIGDTLTSMIHAADLADLIERAATQPEAAGRVYFGADPSPYWMKEVIRTIARVLDRRVLQIPIPPLALWPIALVNEVFLMAGAGIEALTRSRIREFRERMWAVDSTRALEELGWEPRRTLEEGLQDTAQWYIANGWL